MAKKKTDHSETPTIENRKARYDYHIHDTLEVGIALQGSEVKSVRDSQVSLGEGYVRLETDPPCLFLHGVNIGEYGPAGPAGNKRQHHPTRTRVLLAHRREILKLARQVTQKGMTIVPLKLYFKDGYAKLLIGVAEGKAKHDKRHAIAERQAKRDIARAMSKRA